MWHISGRPAASADLQGDIERRDAGGAARVLADPHLDADDHVAVGVRHLHRLGRRHQAELLALAHHHGLGERVDAGERDVQVGEDAHRAGLDHVLAEAGEIAGPGAAGVDRSGDAAGAAEFLRVDAERGAAPIDMGVQVDQAGRDDVAGDVAHVGSRVRWQAGRRFSRPCRPRTPRRRRRRWFCEGSMTRPPLRIRSKGMGSPAFKAPLRPCSGADQQSPSS